MDIDQMTEAVNLSLHRTFLDEAKIVKNFVLLAKMWKGISYLQSTHYLMAKLLWACALQSVSFPLRGPTSTLDIMTKLIDFRLSLSTS